MKKKLSLAAVVVVLAAVGSGCAVVQSYPLQGGEKIIFSSSERAEAYRQWSGNDLSNTGRVVTVTGAAGLKRW